MRRTQLAGIATMLGSAASNQTGAAVGAHAFASIGPPGVVAVRQFVAAAVLLPVARPNLRRFTWSTTADRLIALYRTLIEE